MAKKNSSLPPESVVAETAATSPAVLKHRPTHVARQLRVDLTLAEKAVLSDQLAQAVGRLNETEADRRRLGFMTSANPLCDSRVPSAD